MKTNIIRRAGIALLLLFIIACSTKRNSWLSRNSHALSTKYNILYNGGIALDAGINDLRYTYGDNFWEILPVERMQPEAAQLAAGQAKNPNFQRAEEKATKAIQKHSMNIGGTEKNTQMDEAHLMLGQARYYDQRYVPALEAFNYVLYKYPASSRIYEVKVWREKTNMRLENEGLAINNLTKLLKEIKFKDQIFADANATLAQAFINLEEKDSAIAKLKLATEFTKHDEEKARYQFILAQLFDKMNQSDSAYSYYQKVIDMKRDAPRVYVVQAHAMQAKQFDYKNGDTIAFLEKYDKLLNDRENRAYLNVLNHQMALFYDKQKNPGRALKFYNKSLDYGTQEDQYMWASNYRNVAEIHFNEGRYATAGIYYDSTMIHLKPRTREFRLIEKKRENLNDVIKYEGIAQVNDSIISIYNMPAEQRVAFFGSYIEKLKNADELKRIADEKAAAAFNSAADVASANSGFAQKSMVSPVGSTTRTKSGEFYFYNPTTVAYGKTEFRKNWGNRIYQENWRLVKQNSNAVSDIDQQEQDLANASETQTPETVNPKYTPEFYIAQLPQSRTAVDSLIIDRNFAYYQLGVIYREKFQEYSRSADKFETLLANNPEDRLLLPTLYNLYKLYSILDTHKADEYKNDIIQRFPESRYAQILKDNTLSGTAALTPEAAYNALFKVYEAGQYKQVIEKADLAVEQYTGEPMVAKFELLKARAIGKLRGIEEYKKALNYVSLTFPNQDEGRQAELLIGRDVVAMEAMQFNDVPATSWKILYKAPNPEDKKIKSLQAKIKKFISERTADQLTQSLDLYTENMNFVVIHGLKSEEGAKGVASVLKEFKEYKVTEPAIVISNSNYGVVQIKKNFDEYLADPTKANTPRTPLTAKAADAAKSEKPKLNPRPIKARPGLNTAPPAMSGSGPARPPEDFDQPQKSQSEKSKGSSLQKSNSGTTPVRNSNTGPTPPRN